MMSQGQICIAGDSLNLGKFKLNPETSVGDTLLAGLDVHKGSLHKYLFEHKLETSAWGSLSIMCY